jgi:hypothetical protein
VRAYGAGRIANGGVPIGQRGIGWTGGAIRVQATGGWGQAVRVDERLGATGAGREAVTFVRYSQTNGILGGSRAGLLARERKADLSWSARLVIAGWWRGLGLARR